MAEVDAGLCLVRGLVARKSRVAVDAEQRAALAAGVDPFTPALAATFAASFGFMLPVSTPQNAIVYGSGVVPITQMVRNGFFFDVIGAVLIVIGIPIMVSALGIGG